MSNSDLQQGNSCNAVTQQPATCNFLLISATSATTATASTQAKGEMEMEKEIAVRMFENKKLGTTYAKGLYRTAVFNASVELRDPHIKYLLDFYEYERWQHSACSDQQISTLSALQGQCSASDLVSWVVRYDPNTKSKTPVDGAAILDLSTDTLSIVINDELHEVCQAWKLQTRACATQHAKAPTLIATNTELAQW